MVERVVLCLYRPAVVSKLVLTCKREEMIVVERGRERKEVGGYAKRGF